MTTPHDAPTLIAIASGKGGVGKTFLAISLAQALARAQPASGGEPVLLVDGDLGLANIDIQLGLMPQRDLGAVIEGAASLREAIVPVPTAGFDVLAGRSGSGALASLDERALATTLAALRHAARDYHKIILDIGAGVDKPARRLAEAADTVLLVITEDPTSLTDAYAVLKLLRADRARNAAARAPLDIRVIVNMAGSAASGLRAFETLTRACEGFLRFSPLLAGVVRRDERVREAIRRQTPLLTRAPHAIAAADILHIAARLGGQAGAARKEGAC